MYFESNKKNFVDGVDWGNDFSQKKMLVCFLNEDDIKTREKIMRESGEKHGDYFRIVDEWDKYTEEFSRVGSKRISELVVYEEKENMTFFLETLMRWYDANFLLRKEYYVDYWKDKKTSSWGENIGFERFKRIYCSFNNGGEGNKLINNESLDRKVRNLYFGIVKKMDLEEKMDAARWQKWPYWLKNEYTKEVEILCRFCNKLSEEI